MQTYECMETHTERHTYTHAGGHTHTHTHMHTHDRATDRETDEVGRHTHLRLAEASEVAASGCNIRPSSGPSSQISRAQYSFAVSEYAGSCGTHSRSRVNMLTCPVTVVTC